MATVAGVRPARRRGLRSLLPLTVLAVLVAEVAAPAGRRGRGRAAAGRRGGARRSSPPTAPVGTLAVVGGPPARAAAGAADPRRRGARRPGVAARRRTTARGRPARSRRRRWSSSSWPRTSCTGPGPARPDPARRDDLALLQEMIRRSDDPAASTLWVRYGGGRMVTDVAAPLRADRHRSPAVAGPVGRDDDDGARPRPVPQPCCRWSPTRTTPRALLGWMRDGHPGGRRRLRPAVRPVRHRPAADGGQAGLDVLRRRQPAPALGRRRRPPGRRPAQRGAPVA